MFRGSVKGSGYPPHSTDSPSLPLHCVNICHHISTALYSFELSLLLPSPHNTNPALQHSHCILPSTDSLCLTLHNCLCSPEIVCLPSDQYPTCIKLTENSYHSLRLFQSMQWRTHEFCSTNSVEDRGQRERASWGGSPLVGCSVSSCNNVKVF